MSKYSRGDADKAFELLLIIQNSIDGVIERSIPTRKLLGAENRGQVTCYLDSLLFAMFARHKLFDAILYPAYDDERRQNLIVLIRLWVNMLRLGRLIPTDMVRPIFRIPANHCFFFHYHCSDACDLLDEASPKCAGGMWLAGSRTAEATRCVRSLQLHR